METSLPGNQFGHRHNYSVVILMPEDLSLGEFELVLYRGHQFFVQQGWCPQHISIPLKALKLNKLTASRGLADRAGKHQISLKRERMGRNRLPLKRLTSANRRIAYSRRKKGLMKKASELSVLCGVEVFLVTFSPGGKPTVFTTENSSIENVIEKFAQLNPEERAKKKLECLEVVKKACKKFDHHVDIGELFYPGDLSVEDLTSLADSLRSQLSDTQNRLSYWMNIEESCDADQLGKMEESLCKSLQDIQRHKKCLLDQQLKMCCSYELQHVTDSPIGMGARQEVHPSSWTQNGISQNINFNKDLNFFTQGVPECSFYSNLLCFQEEMGVTRASGEDFKVDQNWSNQLMDLEQELSAPFEFNFKDQPTERLDVQENIMDKNTDKHAEPLQCGSYSMNPSWNSSTSENLGIGVCDNIYPSWESTSGTCSLTLFDDQLYFPLQSPEENVVSCCQYLSPGTAEMPSIDATDKSLDEFFKNPENHIFDEFLSS